MDDNTITRYEDVEIDDIPRNLRFYPSDPSQAHTLSSERIEAYNRDGYIKGMRIFSGDEIDDIEREAYRVTMSFGDEGESELVPYAMGDRGDGDNNHLLCLDRAGLPKRVEFPAGLVTDPREDLNPATSVEITIQ